MSVTATAKSSPRCHLLPDFNSIWELVIADSFFDFFFPFILCRALMALAIHVTRLSIMESAFRVVQKHEKKGGGGLAELLASVLLGKAGPCSFWGLSLQNGVGAPQSTFLCCFALTSCLQVRGKVLGIFRIPRGILFELQALLP